MTTRPLPAFARWLADARQRGMTLRDPTVSVALHGLRRPTIGYGVTVPDDRDPGACDWTWIRNLEVIVFARHDAADRVMRAVDAIAACKPRRLILIDCTNPRTISIVAPQKGQPIAA